MSRRVTLTIPEAKPWLLAAVTACVRMGLDDGPAYDALRVVTRRPRACRAEARANERAAAALSRFFGPDHATIRVLCFIAAVLRAVDGAP